jgi:eukaryotic-like serine/threonine-protein kinase
MAGTSESQADFSVKTLPDRLVGTPNYMSPEQARALPDIDVRSDVYSLGALLYELVTDRLPLDLKAFQAAGKEEMRRIICEVEPLAPSTLGLPVRPERAAQLDPIILRALAKDRASRYPSVTALAEDIQSWLNAEVLAGA